MRFLDTDYFFKGKTVVDYIKASVTGNTMKQSVYWGGEESIFITRKGENVAEEANDDAAVNVEANKTDYKKKYVIVTIEEENNTFEYQETMNVDIENIAIKKQPLWRPIYEVIENKIISNKTFGPMWK